jgi:hypothetical protein
MSSLRLVPNPGQDPADLMAGYGQLGFQPEHNGPVGPAPVPESPAFHRPPPGWQGPNPTYAQGPVGPMTPPEGLPGPIYPGPGWHIGPSVHADINPKEWHPFKGEYGSANYGAAPTGDFVKFVKFGVVDNGLLVIFALAGASADKWIANKLNIPRGWGPVIGAGVGNAVSDFAAGLSDGFKPALGVTLGCLLPLVPVFIASNVMKKSPEHKMTRNVLMGISGAMVIGAYLKK